MTTSARPPTSQSADHHSQFLSMLPRIRRRIRYAFRNVPAFQREDVLQNAIATSFVLYARLIESNKAHLSFANPLARYAIGHIRDNRSVGGQLSRDDVSCPITAKREGFRVERIDRYREDSRGWTCLTIPSRQTPIPEAVAFRLDFDRWLSQQSSRNRRLVAALASGDSTSEAANNFHVSRGRISQLRLQFYRSWSAFQGETPERCTAAA